MNKTSILLALTIALTSTNFCIAQDDVNPTKRYDEIIEKGTFEKTVKIPNDIEPTQDTITLLLPKIDEVLYNGWVKQGIPQIWKSGQENVFIPEKGQNLLTDLGVKKALRQTYANSENAVSIAIYEFNSYESAYSLFTVKHRGMTTELMVGRNASESESGLSFWKSNYFVDISYADATNKAAKMFSVLAGQEISRNIINDTLPPDIAIKIPSLNRVNGTEKYCKSKSCYTAHFPPEVLAVDIDKLNVGNTNGIITAKYISQTKEKAKKKVKPTRFDLILTSYKSDEDAANIFRSYIFAYKEKAEKKGYKISHAGAQLTIQEPDGKHILIKQRGHLLGIICSVQDIEPARKLLGLIPWPTEITFFNPLVRPESDQPVTIEEKDSALREPISFNQ